jgi:hypothetical protein
MEKYSCEPESFSACHNNHCDIFVENDSYPFPNNEQKTECIINITANPIIILFQRHIIIDCPIFL